MTAYSMVRKHISSHGHSFVGSSWEQEKWADSKELASAIHFSTESILDQRGEIDFEVLIRFFWQKNTSVRDFFRKREHIEEILFPFFDFLKHAFFSKNKIIPRNIIDIIENNPSVRNGVISYVEKRNSQIISSQHIEQYDVIAFHLFLLWMEQDFDLTEDVQTDHFMGINTHFSRSFAKIYRILGRLDGWEYENPPEILVEELNRCLQLGETINKLALVHSVNFEERQISFELGMIFRNNADSLLRQLDSRFVENHIIGKKFRYLCWRIQSNFAHWVIINGSTIQKIGEQTSLIKQDMREWFECQRMSGFWWDPREEESSRMVLIGNETITDVVGIERTEVVQGGISPELYEKKILLLRNFVEIYNYGVNGNVRTTEEAIYDFMRNGIKNEYQIEAIYCIVLFDTTIKSESLMDLTEFFLNNKKQVSNFYYEQFVIKIIAQIVRIFHFSKNRLAFLPLIEKIRLSLWEKDISCSILNYSKAYFSLALYYIECKDKKYVDYAKMCFLHYKNLSIPLIRIEQNLRNVRDEREFLIALWRIDELRRYKKQIHGDEDLENSWVYVFETFAEHYQQLAIASIESEVGKIIASMNARDDIYSHNQINDLLGKKIAETIFYNLCTIEIVGDCQKCEQYQSDIICEVHKNITRIWKEGCTLISWKRGFKRKHIHLTWGTFITFTYPSVSEKIFSKIFTEQHELIRERFWNLIAINNKNTLLQESKIELERLAFYDSETELPNENKLSRDILWMECTIVLIDVAGYDNIVATQGGKDYWIEIMKRVAIYLKMNAGATVYRYDKATFCLVYEQSKLADMANMLQEDAKHTVENLVDALLTNFHVEYGSNMRFHAGIVIGSKEEHIKYAHIALTKAKDVREKYLYIFQEGDEKVPEEVRRCTNILIAALNSENVSTKLVPYYQYIHDPENPHIRKFEALARIEYPGEDGEKKMIGPYDFMDIAASKRWLSDLTMSMLYQIISDMDKNPDMYVSVNIHEQDWNDDRIMMIFRSLRMSSGINVDRIHLEILEAVPFDKPEDLKKVQELKSLWYKISIDDYGEDKSNLKKIMLINPHNIKIDQSIIKALYNEKTRSSAIAAIRSVISHAKEIGATVTAEHIESEEVFDLLRNLGVDFFQWYYFAKPLPLEELTRKK